MIFSPTTETTGRHSGAMQSIEPGISRRNLELPDRSASADRSE